ncbi:copper resistance protein CopC [Streptomyces sp. SCSIO 30461]|uniref:copper resistance CopC/CopD family protein n=1 Tax=Streptomyces sp. SCSIO 30461 TaxID=3118085 RepID=UPI0030CF6E59
MTATAPRFGTLGTALVRLLLVTAALIGTLLAGATPASAHAALTGSNPKDGAVLATAPKDVTLTFSEQVAMGNDSIRVLDPKSKRVDSGLLRDLSGAGVVRYGVSIDTDGLVKGTYTVAWQAVSADSHPVAGAFTFSIGAPSRTVVALPKQEAGGGLVGTLYGVARYAAYAGFIMLAGGAAFVLACWRDGAGERPLQRLIVRGWGTLIAATLAMLVLRTPYTGSGELADVLDLGGLKAVLGTKTGTALVSRLLLLGAAALFLAVLFGAYARRGTEAEQSEQTDKADKADRADKNDLTFGLAIGGTVIAAGIAGSWALSEHASTGLQAGIAMPVDVLHMLAAAAWLGGLAAVLVALYRTPALDRAAVLRFSRLAFVSVVVLTLTGAYQSWRQVGSWSALTGTSYGRLLLVKVGLVAVLVGAAAISRRWTTRLAAGTEGTGAESIGTRTDTDTEQGKLDADGDGEPEAARGGGVGSGVGPEAATETENRNETGTGTGGTGAETASKPEPVAPERAAQLARQQVALATAQRKRVRDADPARTGLRRSVLAEAGIAIALLAVTTALTSTEPGRTEENAARAYGSQASTGATPGKPVDFAVGFDAGGTNGKGTLRMNVTPGSSGANALRIQVNGPDGRPLDVPEVKVSFTLEDQAIGPLPARLTRSAPGRWGADNIQVPLPGEWRILLTVRTSDIDQTSVEKNVKIGG